jgi:4-hydroxy-tetrahydrodipicolinate reductase
MLKIIVIGAAGRMGRHLVSCITKANDMTLSGAIEYSESPFLNQDAGTVAGISPVEIKITSNLTEIIDNADAIIDFSTGNVIGNAELAAEKNVAAVIGTTALSDEKIQKLKNMTKNGAKIVLAPNMSVGVNLLFHLTQKVAQLLNDYDIEIVEMHHRRKKDAPSGTAVRLGECAAAGRNLSYSDNVVHGRSGIVGERTDNEIGMHAVRGGDVVGDHTVIFATDGERVELTHKASNRNTFAMGALKAVRFLMNSNSGFYDMQDVLGLKN